MDYIIMDLEWNQPVSKKSYPYLKIGDKMSDEIIQIGAYKVSEELEIVDSFCTYVKPKYYKKLNSVVKKITHINKDEVLSGKSFETAIELFGKWCGDEFCLFTWGCDDVRVMRQNLEFYGLDASFIKEWYDLQTIFAIEHLGSREQRSLQYAMNFFGIGEDTDKQLHDALDDAYYTAEIFVRHDIARCMKEYPLTSDFAQMCAENDGEQFGGFYSKRRALSDKAVSQVLCPECGSVLEKYGRWVNSNGTYVCLASCGEHGSFVSRIKFSKHADGKFYVNKTTKRESESACEAIKRKCDAAYAKALAEKKTGQRRSVRGKTQTTGAVR